MAFLWQNLSNKLEKLQIRALWFVYQNRDSKTEDLLAKSNHSSVHVHRIRKLLCEVYKIVYNISPNIVSDLVQLRNRMYLQKDNTSGYIWHKLA